MSVSALIPRHIFGCRGDIQHGLHQFDETSVLYPAGHLVVLQNTELRTQRFVGGSQDSESICALAVTPSRKHLAIAERAEKGTVTIYDLQTLKRRKVLTSTITVAKDIVSIAFSADSRLLAVQGGAPEWSLVVWAWERAKMVGVMRSADSAGNPVHQVRFSPGGGSESSLVTVAGQGVFRVLRAEDMGLRVVQHSLAKRDTTNFTAHAWIDGDRVAVGTAIGELFIVDSSELKATLAFPQAGEAISAIAAHGKGFIVGTAKGSVCQFERKDDSSYKCMRTHSINNEVAVRAVISFAEDACIVLTSAGQLEKMTFSGQGKGGEVRLHSLMAGPPVGEVGGLSGCFRKPLAASTATDRTLRLWNFHDRSLEMVKAFPDELYGISLHPSGLSALVGFADKLRLLTILLDNVRVVRELPIRACRILAFSQGGHIFAAANGTVIAVFNTFTCVQLGVLRGHSGKVRCLCWAVDDSCLTSAGSEGAIYEWSLKDMKRTRENVLKGCSYACIAVGPSGGTIYAAGSDNKLKALDDAGNVGLRVAAEVDAKCTITQLALPTGGRLLFAATSKGTIRAYKLPLGDSFQELHCSSSSVTQLVLSMDHNQLFAANSEGAVFVFDVKDKDPSRAASADKKEDQVAWAEEVLVTKSDLEEKKQRIAELEAQVVELELAKEYALRMKDLAASQQASSAAESHAAEMQVQRQMLLDLRQELEGLLLERDKQLQQAQEKHQTQVAAMEAACQEKVAAAAKAAQEAAADVAAGVADAERRLAEAEAAHAQALEEMGQELQTRIQEELDNQEALQLTKEAQEREFEILRTFMEDATDQEIEELRARYESKLAAEREANVRLQGENGLMRNKFSAMTAEVTQHKAEAASLTTARQELLQNVALLDRTVAGLRADVKDRNAVIVDREDRISALKAEAQQLAKFKFVLEYKLDEMKSQLEPKEQTIQALQAQLKDMEAELVRCHNRSKALELAVSDQRMQQNALRKDARRHLQNSQKAESSIRLFQRDLQQALEVLHDPKVLKGAVIDLFQKHAADFQPVVSTSNDVLQEYQRQQKFLEGSLEALREQLKQANKQAFLDKARALQEHNLLLTEIESLRQGKVSTVAKSNEFSPLARTALPSTNTSAPGRNASLGVQSTCFD